MKRILRLAGVRILQSVPVVLGITLLVFVLLKLAPGDLVDVMAAESQVSDIQLLEKMRADYGLDKSLLVQFGNYASNVARADLGYSPRDQADVSTLISQRLPATLLLMLAGLFVAIFGGILLGAIAALRVGTWVDNVLSIAMVVFFAAPGFWLALMLIVLFSVKLGWLPVSGLVAIHLTPGTLAYAIDVFKHLVLPAAALGAFYMAIYARVMRASMLEVHGMDFITTARAKGAGEARIALRHVLRNALLPVLTLFGLQLGALLAGSIVIESVFSWPGLGTLLFDAVQARNMPVVAGVLLLVSFAVVVANLVVDIAYVWFDPRIAA
ncbi:ABC transporter permease [Ottowia thiooxydans]|uniref:ABC transporter permease n=1 Tax=Ottowia thiooxydans TaxID=219182 RepID=UPI0004016155|nr:ABC transporter permease [Ottowia thiooxydans]